MLDPDQDPIVCVYSKLPNLPPPPLAPPPLLPPPLPSWPPSPSPPPPSPDPPTAPPPPSPARPAPTFAPCQCTVLDGQQQCVCPEEGQPLDNYTLDRFARHLRHRQPKDEV